MKRILVVLALVLLFPSVAVANDTLPLHPGSSGLKVAALQWLLCGGKPNVFTNVKPTLTCDLDRGYWSPRKDSLTSKAVVAYKYRLGWPAPQWREAKAGDEFLDVLKGTKTRPKAYIARAASRVNAVNTGATKLALKIKALEDSQLTPAGQTAETWGPNWGPQVALYQAVTGQYKTFWCVSFQQWGFLHGGYGTFADRSAGVYYVVDWAARRSLLHAKPKVGALAAFDAIYRRPGGGHMGYVVKVTAAGYVTDEGNASNRVLQRFHPHGSRSVVFVYLHGVA